jgi:hypothetical protein
MSYGNSAISIPEGVPISKGHSNTQTLHLAVLIGLCESAQTQILNIHCCCHLEVDW